MRVILHEYGTPTSMPGKICQHLIYLRNISRWRLYGDFAVLVDPKEKTPQSVSACRALPYLSRDGRIRTGDPLNPIQVRYRAAPRPEKGESKVWR